MKDFIYAVNIEATLIDNSKVTNVNAWVANNKRVYKTADGTELIGDKAIKTLDKVRMLVMPNVLRRINTTYEVKK